jgi:hypothetical protein
VTSEHPDTTTCRRLKKLHVERLLADYDRDPIGALLAAVMYLDRTVTSWADVPAVAPAALRHGLAAQSVEALDALARLFVETRSLSDETSRSARPSD